MTRQTVHLAVYHTLADWEPGLAIVGINKPGLWRDGKQYRVRTVGATTEPVTTSGGMRVVPDMTAAQLRPDDSAMLILPGADTWLVDGGNAEFAAKAVEFERAGVPVAAICGATYGLAKAGLLDDRAHTSNAPEYLARTGYAGADHYRDEPAVTDQGVITAGAISSVEFAREIFVALDLFTPAVLDAWYDLYGNRDSSAFDRLMAAL